jgi:hypothetical protein
MFRKGVDGADQYLSYYSLPRKTIKWTKKVALWLINCAIFNSFLVYKNVNPDSKLKHNALLTNVAKAWATDKMEAAGTESDTDLVRPGPSTPTPRTSRVDPPGQLSGDMWKHIGLRGLEVTFPPFKPGGDRRIFKDGKIQGTESSGRDFKPFDQCSRFTAR